MKLDLPKRSENRILLTYYITEEMVDPKKSLKKESTKDIGGKKRKYVGFI